MTLPSKIAGLSPRLVAGIGALGFAACALAQSSGPAGEVPGLFGPPIAVPRGARSSDSPAAQSKAPNWVDQSVQDAHRKSAGCIECHGGIEEMHASPYVVLGCTDCHGGDPTPGLTMRKAHVAPRNPVFW